MMHGREKSDSAIVAGKPTNKGVSTAAEPVERRAEAKGNASQQSTRRTQSRVSVSQALERIRQAVTKAISGIHARAMYLRYRGNSCWLGQKSPAETIRV